MEAFCGTFTLLNNDDHFGDYMKEVGVDMVTRQMAKLATNTVTISPLAGGKYKMETTSSMKKGQTLEFELNKEIEEETLDGRKTKTTFTIDNGKLVQTQKDTKPDGKDSCIVREVMGDKLTATCTCNKVTSVRTYEKKK